MLLEGQVQGKAVSGSFFNKTKIIYSSQGLQSLSLEKSLNEILKHYCQWKVKTAPFRIRIESYKWLLFKQEEKMDV